MEQTKQPEYEELLEFYTFMVEDLKTSIYYCFVVPATCLVVLEEGQ